MILLIFFIILGILVLCKTKKEFFQENRPSIKFVQSKERLRHGIDTGCLPAFPHEMSTDDIFIKNIFNRASKCGSCQKLENDLVNQGKDILNCLKNNRECVLPDIQENASCEACRLLQNAWKKYYIVLNAVLRYADYGEIPSPPEKGKYNCKNCKNVEKQCEDYAKKVKIEMEHAIKDKYYPTVALPEFKKIEHCPECLKIYEEWTLYTFCLMDIANYASC